MTPVQEKELEVLKALIEVFENNGLHYCAIGGTCLGTVRHKGFIPWDDDVDIALPREEYELFRTKLYKQLPEPLKKLDCDTETYDYLFTKIHNSNTSFIERNVICYPDRFTGAFVDVYPLDGRPDGKWMRMFWFGRYFFYMISNSRRRRHKEGIKSCYGMIKELYGRFLKRIFRFNYFSDALLSLLSKYSIRSCKTAMWNGAWWTDAKKFSYDLSFESDLFMDTVSAPFEDIYIKIPRRYDAYLTTHFGDYMTLPPEEERGKWHDICVNDMLTPCVHYAQMAASGNFSFMNVE